MSSAGRVLAAIPARGGSKGVPRKNLREVGGRPLIAWTLDTALAARHLFADVVVSTDDPEIAALATDFGLEPPFLRPAELSGDRAPTLPVLQHAVAFLEEKTAGRYDWVCLLQPTAPLRSVADLEEAIAVAGRGGCDSVISVNRVEAHHPMLMKKIEEGRLLPYCLEEMEGTRRQDLDPPAYMRNGAIYLTRRDVLMHGGPAGRGSIWGETIHPLLMPAERSHSIDTEIDLRLADILLRERERDLR
jgi:CMP-N,N'-diacetyllegionaminic acid synthase